MPRSRAGRDGNRRGSPVDDAAPVLSTADLTRHCGMVKAVDGITVEIARGALVGIVGANGSGETTFLNLITGYLTPDRGRIEFMGRETTGLPPRAGVLLQSAVTTIFVQHDRDVVQRYARRVLVFDNGRVIAQGETGRVLADAEVRKAILGHA